MPKTFPLLGNGSLFMLPMQHISGKKPRSALRQAPCFHCPCSLRKAPRFTNRTTFFPRLWIRLWNTLPTHVFPPTYIPEPFRSKAILSCLSDEDPTFFLVGITYMSPHTPAEFSTLPDRETLRVNRTPNRNHRHR